MTENIENGSIAALRRQVQDAAEDQIFWMQARAIARAGGTVQQIMALRPGLDEGSARALLNPKSLMYQTENIAVSGRRVDYLKKKLAQELLAEKQRMRKKGLL